MASVHDYPRNKWRYLELVDYFELLARENAHIGHDPLTHKAFVRTDIMDIGRAKTTGLMSPYLAIEDPSARPLNDNMENIQLLWSTAIVVGIEVRQGDEVAEREAMDRAVRILVTIMARIKEDRRRMRILDFEFPSVRINKVREHFRNTVGYRMAFDFPTQMDLSVTPQDWPDYDFSQDLPAFAMVIDQGQEIRLGQNGLYTCAIQPAPPATWRLVDTDTPPNELDTGSIDAGDEGVIVAPNATVTRDGQPFNTVRAGGNLNVPSAGVNLVIMGDLIETLHPTTPIDFNFTVDGLPQSVGYDPGTNTLQATSAPCPSSTISIDSVPIETLSAGAGLDLSVQLDGNPVTPTYDDLTKTIGVTSPPGAVSTTALPMRTGQTVSYQSGDDGDLEAGRDASFLVLSENNPFGNANRFTDLVGGQTYAAMIAIDWSTYEKSTGRVIWWYLVRGGITNWTTAISSARALTVGGYTNWRLPNVNEMVQIYNLSIVGNPINYAPFNSPDNALWLGNTAANGVSGFYAALSSYGIGVLNKATSIRWLAVRTGNISELSIP